MLPTGSNVHSIPGVIEALSELNPKTIIDVGCGCGKYGMLVHEYLKELEYVDGIEPHKQFMNNPNKEWYRRIGYGKIQDCLLDQKYDVGLLTAVIGKFNKDELKPILDNLLKHCKKLVITVEVEAHGLETQWDWNKLSEMYPNAQMHKLAHEWLWII